MKLNRDIKILIGLGVLASISVVLYWLAWFIEPSLVQTNSPQAHDYVLYVDFQQAFILADAWFSISAMSAAVGLWRRRPWGLLFTFLGGGSAVFLGLLDLLYDLQHGVFSWPLSSSAVTEFAIVAFLLTLGPLSIILSWRLCLLMAKRPEHS